MSCGFNIAFLSAEERDGGLPADPRLIDSLHSLSDPVLWLFFRAHSHLFPASLQVEWKIHSFQGRNPLTDHFLCSSRQFLLG